MCVYVYVGEQLGTNNPFFTAGIVNGVLIFATFALTLPAIAMPTRGWLKLSAYFIVFNAMFSVILGLYLWIITLRTKETFSPIWNAQTASVQGLMQTTVRQETWLRLTARHRLDCNPC